MLYILFRTYAPNTAVLNRIMAYVSSISEMGHEAVVVFFSPDCKFSKVQRVYPHISIKYLWEKNYIDKPILKYLSFALYFYRFRKMLREGDKVYIYGMAESMGFLIGKKGVEYYGESTEHPDISLGSSRFFRINEKHYFNCCQKLDGMFVISQGLKSLYIEKGLKPERVHIINMFVDTTRFDIVEKQCRERYIAYCGSASNNKDGVDKLIQAFAITASKHTDVKLYIIGGKPAEGELFKNAELANVLGVADKIVFTGVVPTEHIPKMLIHAEILALDRPDNKQSKYGFPTKLGEYLCSGNPVVVTQVGDISLFLKDGKSAMLAESTSPEIFSTKMNYLLENPTEAKKIGQQGRQVAMENFNAMIETKKMLKYMGII